MNEYFERLQALLAASPFVHEPLLLFDDRKDAWFIRGDIYFIDNSRMHFRELFVGQGNPAKIAYSYHYQRADAKMVFRYDNSPHYPDLSSAPHHKHTADENVIESNLPDFETVLREIENLIAVK
ncbi:MAG: DUF6516 family protein [Chloroflexota bacterium]